MGRRGGGCAKTVTGHGGARSTSSSITFAAAPALAELPGGARSPSLITRVAAALASAEPPGHGCALYVIEHPGRRRLSILFTVAPASAELPGGARSPSSSTRVVAAPASAGLAGGALAAIERSRRRLRQLFLFTTIYYILIEFDTIYRHMLK